MICRKRAAAAAEAQRTAGGDVEQKRPDNIYNNILRPAEPEGRPQPQDAGQAVDDVSYASVQFRHKNQSRPVEEAEDATIYSSVASRR